MLDDTREGIDGRVDWNPTLRVTRAMARCRVADGWVRMPIPAFGPRAPPRMPREARGWIPGPLALRRACSGRLLVRVAAPALSGPRLAAPAGAGPRLAAPALAGPRLAAPALAGPRFAAPALAG